MSHHFHLMEHLALINWFLHWLHLEVPAGFSSMIHRRIHQGGTNLFIQESQPQDRRDHTLQIWFWCKSEIWKNTKLLRVASHIILHSSVTSLLEKKPQRNLCFSLISVHTMKEQEIGSRPKLLCVFFPWLGVFDDFFLIGLTLAKSESAIDEPY